MCADQEIPAETVQGLSEPLMKTQVHGRQTVQKFFLAEHVQ